MASLNRLYYDGQYHMFRLAKHHNCELNIWVQLAVTFKTDRDKAASFSRQKLWMKALATNPPWVILVFNFHLHGWAHCRLMRQSQDPLQIPCRVKLTTWTSRP